MYDVWTDIEKILEKTELEAQAEAELHMDLYRLVLAMMQEEAYKERGLDRSSLHARSSKNALLKTVRNNMFEIQSRLGILLTQESVQRFALGICESISEYVEFADKYKLPRFTNYEDAVPALNSERLNDAYLYQKALVGAAKKVREEIEEGALEELLRP